MKLDKHRVQNMKTNKWKRCVFYRKWWCYITAERQMSVSASILLPLCKTLPMRGLPPRVPITSAAPIPKTSLHACFIKLNSSVIYFQRYLILLVLYCSPHRWCSFMTRQVVQWTSQVRVGTSYGTNSISTRSIPSPRISLSR